MKIKYALTATSLATTMIMATGPANAIDFYYCGYCDGASLTFNTTNLTTYGVQNGCTSGPAYGGLVYGLANRGLTAAFGYGSTATYADAVHTEVTFVPPYNWRHTDNGGGVINSGTVCFGLPPATAGAPSSIGN